MGEAVAGDEVVEHAHHVAALLREIERQLGAGAGLAGLGHEQADDVAVDDLVGLAGEAVVPGGDRGRPAGGEQGEAVAGGALDPAAPVVEIKRADHRADGGEQRQAGDEEGDEDPPARRASATG
jgi:hypothetical protein